MKMDENVMIINYKQESCTIETIMREHIGKERKWSNAQMDADMKSLKHNRLETVGDLRLLSDESWSVIQLLPFVKVCKLA